MAGSDGGRLCLGVLALHVEGFSGPYGPHIPTKVNGLVAGIGLFRENAIREGFNADYDGWELYSVAE